MRLQGDGYVLLTGKTFYANNGILGLSGDGEWTALTEGYDSTVDAKEGFTLAERQEIADFMIEVWRRWAL